MPDIPSLVMIVFFVGSIAFFAGRSSVREDRENTVLKRIIERKYAARVEREKRKTAEEVARSIDAFVSGLTGKVNVEPEPRD